MTQYLDQAQRIADLESELCLLRYKLKQLEAERASATDDRDLLLTAIDERNEAREAMIAPILAKESTGPRAWLTVCGGCNAVVDEPHTWKQCAEAMWNDYECENAHRCEVECALQEAHEALKLVLAQRDAALDYIDHVDTCARCDGALMGPQPEDNPAHCEDCHPDEFESEKWHEEYERLSKLVEAAMAEREHLEKLYPAEKEPRP